MRLSGKSLAVLVALFPLPAMATDIRGNINCKIDDRNAVLSLKAMFSYRDDKPIFAVKGMLDLKPADSQIAGQRHVLNAGNLLQQWFYDSDLRFRFLIPTEDGSVSFAIQTSRIGDGQSYEGTYDFGIAARGDSSETVDRAGDVTCTTD